MSQTPVICFTVDIDKGYLLFTGVSIQSSLHVFEEKTLVYFLLPPMPIRHGSHVVIISVFTDLLNCCLFNNEWI